MSTSQSENGSGDFPEGMCLGKFASVCLKVKWITAQYIRQQIYNIEHFLSLHLACTRFIKGCHSGVIRTTDFAHALCPIALPG